MKETKKRSSSSPSNEWRRAKAEVLEQKFIWWNRMLMPLGFNRDAILEMMVREYTFDPKRKWRFDFAWPALKIAVEIEGGTWTQGSHVRGERYSRDCEKYNEAQAQGWKVYRFTTDQVRGPYSAIWMIRRVWNLVPRPPYDKEMPPCHGKRSARRSTSTATGSGSSSTRMKAPRKPRGTSGRSTPTQETTPGKLRGKQ